jgi:hypothetical protein
MVVLILLAAGSACAETLTPDAAQHFVTGKLFAFNCFDGSRGAGRIYGDGSVTGTIQFRGAGPEHRCQRAHSGPEARQFARRSGACRLSRASILRRPMTAASAARGWGLPIAISPRDITLPIVRSSALQ